MSAVMLRLRSSLNLEPSLPKENESTCHWSFTDTLAEKNSDFFRPLVRQHALLTIEYSVLCTQLTHDYFHPNRNEKVLREQLATALMVAELLTRLYQDYLNVPREVIRLRKEQVVYRQLLSGMGYGFDELTPETNPPDFVTQKIRGYTVASNWLRLTSVRAKRVLNAFVPLVDNLSNYYRIATFIEKYAGPFFNYLGWIFFIPRLLTNLFLLMKHLLEGWWMSKEEKSLSIWDRLYAQMQRRWFELANDSVWMVGGVLSCFLWLGPLAIVGVYVGIGLYVYDVVLAVLRIILEITRLNNLRAEYQALAAAEQDPDVKMEIERNLVHLQNRILFEQQRLMVSVITTALLVVAACLCLPALFAVNPLIPLAGACLFVTVTVLSYIATNYIETLRPVEKVASFTAPENARYLPKYGLFKPAPPNIDPNPEETLELIASTSDDECPSLS
jgi:hypothetical protein